MTPDGSRCKPLRTHSYTLTLLATFLIFIPYSHFLPVLPTYIPGVCRQFLGYAKMYLVLCLIIVSVELLYFVIMQGGKQDHHDICNSL